MVLRATGPCSSTDRRITLALARRRSRTGEGGDREGGATVLAMEFILGSWSGRAPSRTPRRDSRDMAWWGPLWSRPGGPDPLRPASGGVATGGGSLASQVDIATRREVQG